MTPDIFLPSHSLTRTLLLSLSLSASSMVSLPLLPVDGSFVDRWRQSNASTAAFLKAVLCGDAMQARGHGDNPHDIQMLPWCAAVRCCGPFVRLHVLSLLLGLLLAVLQAHRNRTQQRCDCPRMSLWSSLLTSCAICQTCVRSSLCFFPYAKRLRGVRPAASSCDFPNGILVRVALLSQLCCRGAVVVGCPHEPDSPPH